MRLISATKSNNIPVKRLMIYSDGSAVLLFGYLSESDCAAAWDLWFEDMDDAFDACMSKYGVEKSDWMEIPDPLEYCQQDWIATVRIKGRDTGSPRWGEYEILIDGTWNQLSQESKISRTQEAAEADIPARKHDE